MLGDFRRCGFLLMLAAATCTAADRPARDLNGTWEFRTDPHDVGRAQGWFQPGVPFTHSIQVPGAWNAQGFSFESPDDLDAYEAQRLAEQTSLNDRGILGVQRESERLFHTFPGPAWYRRDVTIPVDWAGKTPWLVFNGVHREVEVWINGHPAGLHRSYLIPFRIDLSSPEFAAETGQTLTITARVDARRDRDLDPLMGCLDTLDFLYVTWGGIHQPVYLEGISPTRISDVFLIPDLNASAAEARITVEGPKPDDLEVAIEIFDADGTQVSSVHRRVEADASETVLVAPIPNARHWSPASPHLYRTRVTLQSAGIEIDTRSVRFGMREFRVVDGRFLLNGQPIFLRGYGDDAIFPNTIAPPADKDEFRARLARAREFGFNFVRHHSWTPPEAYLEAADELGIMLQPEFPFAYRWDLPTTPEAQRSALEQWESLIRLNRNHPSIVSWCMGNEQYDSFPLAPAMYSVAKRLDPTRPVIDSDGCGFQHADRDTLDYLVVQFDEGRSIGHGDGKYDIPPTITKPVIAHEMGYFVTLHDLGQIDRFERGLRPYWLHQTRDLANRNGVLAEYPEWLSASYRLQAACLKTNIEAARRSRLSGTSIWLFHDYPNCAEGVVSMFGQAKGLTPEAFRAFNAPTVLLLDIPRRNAWCGETLEPRFVVSRFEDPPSAASTLRWHLDEAGQTLASGQLANLVIPSGGLQELPPISLDLPALDHAATLTLHAELVDGPTTIANSWNLWVYPRRTEQPPLDGLRVSGFLPLRAILPEAIDIPTGPIPTDTNLLVTTTLDPDARHFLEEGGRVLLLDPAPTFAVEPTNFRLSSWDGGGPSGTVIDTTHPALRAMPTEGWCDLQFYPLIQDSKTTLLSGLSVKIEPLVRCIDRPTRLADRAYLFEVAVGRGKLLVSSFNFDRALDSQDPAAAFLLDQLIRYAHGPDFTPHASLPTQALPDGSAP